MADQPREFAHQPLLEAALAILYNRARDDDFASLLSDTFHAIPERLQPLQQALREGTLPLPRFVVVSGEAMEGAWGGFSATGTTQEATIYLQEALLEEGADAARTTWVVLEELGHFFDHWLNEGVDSQGDEGEAFAGRVLGITRSAEEQAAIASEDDRGVVHIDGQAVVVEQSASGLTATGGTYSLSASTLAYSVTRTATSGQGPDLLVAFYSAGGTLMGWRIEKGAFSGTSFNGSFDFAASGVTRLNDTTLLMRAWQGTAGSSYSAGQVGNSTTLAAGSSTGFYVNASGTTTSPVNSTGRLVLTGRSFTGGNTEASFSSVRVDMLGPTVTAEIVRVDDDKGPLTGALLQAGRSDDGTLSLSGTYSDTLRTSESIRILDNGVDIGAATANTANRTWSFTTAELAEGTHAFSVRVVDEVGNAGSTSAPFALTIDKTAPLFSSSSVAAPRAENSGSGQVVATAVASDASGPVAYSLKAGGDAAQFSIDASSGAITLLANPNFETKAGYTVTVVASDAVGNRSEQALSLAITDVNEAPTALTLLNTTPTLAENTSTASRIKVADISISDDALGSETLSLSGADAASFEIDGTSLYLKAGVSLNYEAQSAYAVTVSASDAALPGSAPVSAVFSLAVSNKDEVAPSFTSAGTAHPIAENSGANQVVYTATTTDSSDYVGGSTSYSLKATGDAASFSIQAGSGAVTLLTNPNFEAKNSYSFTIIATDAAGNSAERTVTLAIYNVAEAAPSFSSPSSATVTENSSGTVYTAIASPDAGGVITYSLSGPDASRFTINANNGALSFNTAPDFEAPADNGSDNIYNVVIQASEAGNPTPASLNLAITVSNAEEGAPGPSLVGMASPGVVDVSSDLQITFASAIARGSQGAVKLWKQGGELMETFDASSSALGFSGSSLTINPLWDLDGNANYYLTMDAGAIQGSNGVAYAGLSDASTLTFQTDVEIRGALGSAWLRDQFPGTSSESIGNHSALFIRATFPDVNRTPGSLELSQAVMNDVAAFYADNSRGRISLTTTYTPLVSLDFSHQWHVAYDSAVNGLSAIQWAARQAALELGFDSNQYNVTVVQLDKALRSGASWGGGDSVWLAWTGSSGTAAHEIGHALGLSHANSITWNGASNEYGNQTDNMGSGDTGPDHFIVPKKTGLGWMDGNDVLVNPGSGIYRLHAADASNQVAGNIYGITQVIPADQIGANPTIGLEYRPAQGGDFEDALVLFRNNDVLKYVAGGPIDLSASLGKSYRLPGSEMVLTVLAKGDGYLDVAYQQGPFTGNSAPSATFTATASSIKRFDSVTFSADALDGEGDQLVYHWSFSDGVVGAGRTYTRAFHQSAPTNVTVTLEVSDLRGGLATLTGTIAAGAASSSGSLSVGTLTPPTLDKPRVSVLASDAFAAEGSDAGTFTISRIGTANTDPLVVNLAWSGSGLGDFTGLPSSVTIPSGQNSVVVTVTPTDDVTVETGKRLNVAIVADTAYTISAQNGSAAAQVNDNDLTVVTVTTIDGSASEAGRDMGMFRIERTGSTAEALTVYYGLAGTAYNGADYGRLDGQVVIQAGQSFATVAIVPMVDADGEPEETVTLTLATFNDAYSVGAACTGTVTIKDASSRPTISVTNTYGEAIVTEGGTAKIVFTANGGSGEPVDVQYTISGTASSGSDFTPQSGTITLPTGGSNTVTLAIPVLADGNAENDERLVLSLSPAAAYSLGLDTSAQITILEPVTTASGGDRVRVSRWYEGDPKEAGSNPASFYLYRDSTDASRQALNITYALSGTATPGGDYTGEVRLFDGTLLTTFSPTATNSVTIPANADAVVIRLIPVDDALPEGAETINFSIVSVSGGAVIGINSTAGYVLTDNDNSATLVGFLTLSSLWQEERNPADNIHTLTVSLNQAAPTGGVQVAYRPDGGTALGYGIDWVFVDQNGADMSAMNGMLDFAAGETSKSIRVRVVNDRITESKETFSILLENAVGASLQSGASRHTVTLYDVIPEGLVTEERWAGSSVFTNNSWDSTPVSDTGYLDGFTSAQNIGDNFSRRLSGFITAPSTGQYTFYASGDDAVRLYVGSSESASSKVLVASVPSGGWTGYQQWNKYTSQQSNAISLVAGQKIYVEVQHQENSGGDHVSIGWSGPGFSSITPISTATTLISNVNRYLRFLTESTTVREGQALSQPIVVSLDRAQPDATVTVGIEVVAADSTATGSDYVLASSTLSFAPGEVAKALDFTALMDSNHEAIEKLTLRLVNASGARITGPASHTIRLVDANAPQLGSLTTFATRGDAAGISLGQIAATAASGRSLSQWEIVAGNPHLEGSANAAFAIDGQGRISLLNPEALPLSSLQLQLTIRATDNLGSSSLTSASVVVNGQSIKEERWNGQATYNSGDWSTTPASTEILTNFEAPRDIGDYYSRRISGVFTPQSSGEYSFWIAARDKGRLTIASFDNPTNEREIASSGDVDFQNWDATDQQQSAPQTLVAGSRYILRAYQSEAYWGDHLSVAWSGPGFTRQLMPASAFLGSFGALQIAPSELAESTVASVATYSLAASAATDTGLSSSIPAGGFTRDTTLDLSGSADAGALVRVYRGQTLVGSTTAGADGRWTLTTPTLADGDHTFRAEVMDGFGNVALTGTRTYTVRSQIAIDNDQLVTRAFPGSSHTTTGATGITPLSNGAASVDQGVITYKLGEDLFVADVSSGTVQLVTASAASASLGAAASVSYGATSNDGRYVVFGSSAVSAFGSPGAAFGDSNATSGSPYSDLFVFDRTTGNLRLITAGASANSSASQQAELVGISADSRSVVFTTSYVEKLGNFLTPGKTAPATDVVAFNLSTGERMLLSHSATSATQSLSANVSNVSLSNDGRYVLFNAADASKLGNNGSAFVDTASNVADLFAADLQTGQIQLLSRTGSDVNSSAGVATTLVGTTSSGYAIFSAADAAAFGFSDGARSSTDLFAYNLATGSLQLASRTSSAAANTSAATDITVLKVVGNHVYFTAKDATAFGFSNDADTSQADLFRFDPATGKLELLSHSSSSTTTALPGQYMGGLTVSPDGRYVAFVLDMRTSSGGFTINVGGTALFLADTQTGAIRILNASNTAGTTLSYAAWAAIENKTRTFSPDSKALIWQTPWSGYVASDKTNSASGWSNDTSTAFLVDLSNGVQNAGTTQVNQLLSHAPDGTTVAASQSVTLIGVSEDSRLAYFSTADASRFGNDGVAFGDAAPASNDVIAVDLSNRRLELLSGAAGTSLGQAASVAAIGDGGAVVLQLGNLGGLAAVPGVLSDANGNGTDLYALRTNLLDLVSRDDSSDTGEAASNHDNITTRSSFVLRSLLPPGRSVELLDNGSVVDTQVPGASGIVNWELSGVAAGVHLYSLRDTAEQVPVKIASGIGASDLRITVVANAAPTALSLANAVSSLPEGLISSGLKVADLVLSDDSTGVNTFSLSGNDAAVFTVVGKALFLKAGTNLDYESKAQYSVTIAASDATLSGSTPVSTTYNLTLTDVNEAALTLAATAITNSGMSASVAAGGVTRDASLGLHGQATAGSTVYIYSGTSLLGTTVAAADNSWSYTTATLSDGEYTFQARMIDPAGSTLISENQTFTVRTQRLVDPEQLISQAVASTSPTTTSEKAVGTILAVRSINQGVITYESLIDQPFTEQRWSGSTAYTTNSWDAASATYNGTLSSLTPAKNVGDNYSRRITGWITAPSSGDYTFYIASDDGSKLYLSTDDTAGNKRSQPIASVSDWGNYQDWTATSSQKSVPVSLQAGQRYYIEVQHLEGSGGDHVSVAWTGPGISSITPITSPVNVLIADAASGTVQLVSHSAAGTSSAAGVPLSYGGTSADGRTVVFSSSQASAFGNNGTAFTDTNSLSGSTASDLFVYDRTTQALRLLTASATATTTRSRQAEFVGISADSRYVVYTTDYVEQIGSFSAPGKTAASSWTLVDGGYPNATGKLKTTTLRVADIDPTKLSYQLSGGYISSDGQSATVSTVTIKRPSTDKLSFWVEGSLENKAVKLELEDTSSGILVKATAAKYGAGTNADWDTQGSVGQVATSLSGNGYGVSLLQASGSNLTPAMVEEGAQAARDIVAFDLATGSQLLLSHSATAGHLQSQAGDVRDVTLSADGRYVLFTAANASKFGNNGAAFTDTAPGVTDLFAADLQTGQIRLLSHAATSTTSSAAVAPTLLGSTSQGWAIFSAADASAFGFSDSATGTTDLVAANLSDGSVKLISRASSASPGSSAASAITFEKTDGKYVYFSANNATAFGFSSDADTTRADLFRYDPGSGSLELLSHAISSTTAALGGSYRAGSVAVSPNGRFVAFVLNMQAASGGFSVGITGDALFLADTQTGAIRLVNASDSAGQNLSYSAWAGIQNYRRFFSADSKSFAWDSSYGSYVNSDRSGGASGWDGQYGVNAYVVDLSNGVVAAGSPQTNRLISHSPASTTQAAAASVTLVGVSADSRLLYFTAADASKFGNGGTAFSDNAAAAADVFAYDISTRAISLVSGENGVSYGQSAGYQGAADGGATLMTLANLSGFSSVAGSLSDPNGTGTDLLASRLNLLDLRNSDDTSETGTDSDNITSRTSFTLQSLGLPGRAIQLLDNGEVVASQSAPTSGLLSWSLTNVALGEHTYSLQDSSEGVPLRSLSSAGASSLKLTVIADTFAPNDPIINYVSSDDRTPDFRITAEAGATVRVYDGDTLLGTATETLAAGAYAFTASILASGSHSFTARATDAAGNLSGLSIPWLASLPGA